MSVARLSTSRVDLVVSFKPTNGYDTDQSDLCLTREQIVSHTHLFFRNQRQHPPGRLTGHSPDSPVILREQQAR
jgi:hypothetical protein